MLQEKIDEEIILKVTNLKSEEIEKLRNEVEHEIKQQENEML